MEPTSPTSHWFPPHPPASPTPAAHLSAGTGTQTVARPPAPPAAGHPWTSGTGSGSWCARPLRGGHGSASSPRPCGPAALSPLASVGPGSAAPLDNWDQGTPVWRQPPSGHHCGGPVFLPPGPFLVSPGARRGHLHVRAAAAPPCSASPQHLCLPLPGPRPLHAAGPSPARDCEMSSSPQESSSGENQPEE